MTEKKASEITAEKFVQAMEEITGEREPPPETTEERSRTDAEPGKEKDETCSA